MERRPASHQDDSVEYGSIDNNSRDDLKLNDKDINNSMVVRETSSSPDNKQDIQASGSVALKNQINNNS